MSGEGANLEVESQIGIPNSFNLVIDSEHSNHQCHVVWRKARRIGAFQLAEHARHRANRSKPPFHPLHLTAIGRKVAPGSHAALVLDGAGYHVAAALTIPENITLMRLSPYAPELNPIENVWEYLRGNKLAIARRLDVVGTAIRWQSAIAG